MPELDLQHLKTFQNNRLRGTYADFIAQPSYEATCRFFFDNVYKAEDSTARDQAFVAFHHKIRRVLGGDVILCLRQLIDLQQLTNQLDGQLLEVLAKMEIPHPLTVQHYEDAYARCNNYQQRVLQIEQLLHCINLSNKIFHSWGIGTGLKALHRFHQFMGDTQVTDFLLEGYHAMTGLKNLAPLTVAINERERIRLDRIYGILEDGVW